MAALASNSATEGDVGEVKNDFVYEPPSIDNEDNLGVYSPDDKELEMLGKFGEEHGEEFASVPPGKRLRFLRARDMNIDKAAKMLRNHVEWFNEHKPNEIKEEEVNRKALDSECWRYLGQTDDGSGIMEVRVSKWNPHEYTKDEYIKYVAFFQVMAERMLNRDTKNVVIFDMAGWAMWHGSYMGYINRLVDIAQNQYPERLRRVLLVNAPFLFRGAWSIISPWLDPVTKAKVKFVTAVKDLREEFGEVKASLDLLPKRYGGNIEDESLIPCPGFLEHMASAAQPVSNEAAAAAGDSDSADNK